MTAAADNRTDDVVLKVRDLSTHFVTSDGVAEAVRGVDLTLRRGRTLGLVGESGCGKSVTALSIMRLVPDPPGKIVSGKVLLGGRDLLGLSEHEMRSVRGREVAMVFQEPMTSLNPVFTVGDQIAEAVRVHKGAPKREALQRAAEMLETVRIPDAAERIRSYPHELSGGQQQRVMIAMALVLNPRLLIADEPTTALDVTIQAQILALLRDLQQELSMAVLFITHDMAVVAETADDVAVMYAGRIVESAAVSPLFARPLHPYTRLLFRSIPTERARGRKLETIAGTVPDLRSLPTGCKFHPRCPMRNERCIADEPELREVELGRLAACHRAEEVEGLMR
jgi:oligopeptide/dipeptide ABC transporter ATP-binding protein